MDRTTSDIPEIRLNKNYISIFCNPELEGSEKINLHYLKSKYSYLFYPQDWYEKESFMNESFEPGWYYIPIKIQENSRGKYPDTNELYPASLLAYVFIMFYQKYSEILWPHDYIWCNTFDSNNDRIYVGRYYDPLKLSKNGFSIHRHLTIKNNYGWL
jgi:hypothetical protein